MTKHRTESDSMGQLQVPQDALYGAQTQRAVDNFPISGRQMPAAFISALALVKRCAALANVQLGLLDKKTGAAIAAAARAVQDGAHGEQFPVDIYQTGSGTSSNMNMNEVLAHLAAKASGADVHPNDHVNMGQSSNDVIPTSIHIAAVLQCRQRLLPALAQLHRDISARADGLDAVVKTGRTHLMDAMPIRMGQELGGWALQVQKAAERIEDAQKRLQMLAQGGTAVGTGINTHPDFARTFAARLNDETGAEFVPNASFFESLGSQDAALELSGQLKTLAAGLMKMANDLRWMNSGPLAGIGEIRLPALQPGSSIMPGKVNPVAAEAVAMVAARVIGNDATITIAAQSGNFQLNVMLPVVADALLESLHLLAAAMPLLAAAIKGFEVCEQNLQRSLAQNPILVTALNPVIGYAKAAQIAKTAYAEGRAIIDVAAEHTDLPRAELERILDPAALTKGGIRQ